MQDLQALSAWVLRLGVGKQQIPLSCWGTSKLTVKVKLIWEIFSSHLQQKFNNIHTKAGDTESK